MATVADSIRDFELYMDDTTELSEAEEIRLVDKIYQRVSYLIPWERLKKEYSGTASGTTLSLPARFAYIVENDNYTENGQYGAGPVVYIGSERAPWKVVSFSDRRNYRERNGYAWVDIANDNLVFSADPGAKAVEFDYIEYPTTLSATTDELWIPDRFAPIVYHGMCIDDFVIQQSEKARSYRDEHLANYNMYLNDMKSWNYNLVQLT